MWKANNTQTSHTNISTHFYLLQMANSFYVWPDLAEANKKDFFCVCWTFRIKERDVFRLCRAKLKSMKLHSNDDDDADEVRRELPVCTNLNVFNLSRLTFIRKCVLFTRKKDRKKWDERIAFHAFPDCAKQTCNDKKLTCRRMKLKTEHIKNGLKRRKVFPFFSSYFICSFTLRLTSQHKWENTLD